MNADHSMQPTPTAGDVGRAPAVRDMFARIASRYDRANLLMSFGVDRLWRRAAIRELGTNADGDVLDWCAGTMDFSLLLAARSRSLIALDFCQPMLDAGTRRLPPDAHVRTICADARDMPLPDASVDAVIAGFGIRNVPEPHRALAEAIRVLRPGGRLVIVDFFRPTTWLARWLDASYNRVVLPLIGGAVTGETQAYRYLAASMGAWCNRVEFEAMCRDAGFNDVRGRDLFPPLASIVSATR